MRHAIFGNRVAAEPMLDAKATIGEALTFDIVAPPTSDDEVVAEKRSENFTLAPLLLFVSHCIIGAALLLIDGSATLAGNASALAPLILAILLDGGVAMLFRFKDEPGLRPFTIMRTLMLYVASSSTLFIFFAGVLTDFGGRGDAGLLGLSLGAGLCMQAIIAVGSPPVAIVNALMATTGAALFARSPAATGAVAALSLAAVGYSVSQTQQMIAAARRRLRLDWQAKKALQFVAEFESSGRGWFWETNSAGTLSYVSQQLADDFETTPEALLGRQFTDLLSVDNGSGDALREERTLGFHLSARFPFSEVVVRAATNEDIHWSLSGNPIFDENGRFLGFRGIGADLTEQRRNEQEISRLARFDSLTGLPNRAMMRQTLDEALRNAARRQRGCSLFLIDLDRFKNVNDTLGHPVGDALLKQVAERLKSVMGDHGQVGRLGGDEFKAVLPGTVDIGLLESLARTLIDQVSQPYRIEGHRVTIGASVGVAIGDPGRTCADALVRNADLALYAAKGAGRGKHCFYEPAMHSEASDRQLLENDLRQALERGELSVCYQPIVRAVGEDVAGFEALVRWTHASRGAISPAKFIPLAEECGMIGKIGEWVLKTALAEAARWPDRVRIAVNLSPIQFNNPGIVGVIDRLLGESGVRPGRLELEITEGVFLAEGDATDETFARLKNLGVRLALDDFGTGYSSLGYLKKAPFDKIKIDQSFVRGAASPSSRNSAIIRAIVTLAESLNMDTVAEGVETHDDLQLIRDLGCSQIQGYIFGKPGDAEIAGQLARAKSVEAEGFQCIREPRQRLMRRAIAGVNGVKVEVRLRNISAMGALIECDEPVAPGQTIVLDIVGVGPVTGAVRWSAAGRFGVQFADNFELTRLAPVKPSGQATPVVRPAYLNRAAG
ncbi:EAL domain-containing protein [Sphingomonas ginkgonis]|uniref:EAL domain-containing protein n=1 Tax=Sphingomonas ginkgonis TaxID=2315330 RepID=A0A3S0ENZ7_9SPHN|nr:EAL domain-containing protein [Sphingomonas ginkgonis]RST31868.1 EAL domain-containing protein [Sphingomonas ginkgonis]